MSAPLQEPKTKWWHAEGDRLVCDLCPRECRLGEGQRGFCFVRQNVDGRMVLTTYGRSTGFCIDPIEKKPLNHFLPGTPVLSFGTAGCNLGCKFCQNWDISKSREIEILSQQASPEAIVQTAKSHGCRSIAFTYNDPVIWAEYAIETAKIARAEGIKTVAVTAGYITPAARGEFFEWMDAANVDLKAFTDEFYRKQTFSRIDPVLDTLRWLKHETGVWFEITNLIIPGENDSPDETARLCDWVLEELGPDVPLHFTAFHPDFKLRDRGHTPHDTLIQARSLARERGLRHVYVGNVLDGERQSTYCPGCERVVIERDHYELGAYHIREGACTHCGTTIPGVFENEPGHWGRKRVPLSIREPERPASIASPTQPESVIDADARAFLLDHARHLVTAAVRGESPTESLPEPVASFPCHGLFVSLKRGHQLRGCIGHFQPDQARPISALLAQAAASVATRDVRFPPIQLDELPYLSIEVTPMHGFRDLDETGAARAGVIEIGRHGVILSQGDRRGLLLPQVAVEHGYDAAAFLRQVSLKAGLPPDAWLAPDSRLTVFEGEPFSAEPPRPEIDGSTLSREDFRAAAALAVASLSGATGEMRAPAILTRTVEHPLGVIIETGGRRAFALRAGASLAQLILDACQSLRSAPNQPDDAASEARLHLLSLPISLRPAHHPQRHAHVLRGAIVARAGDRFAIALPTSDTTADPIAEALRSVGISLDQWADSGAEVVAFQRHSVRFSLHSESSGDPGGIRPAAVAGRFYPGTADEMARALDSHFEKARAAYSGAPQPARAVLLPHAGWIYCGDLIAGALARVAVPELVVVIGPKHTPHGANWSVSSSDAWEIPGATIPVAREWADFLAARCPRLIRETAAHRAEHGCEVLLPFLHRCQPRLRIVPIAIGEAGYDDLASLAGALADLRAEWGDRVLLVISSDLNHFADEAENRRRDALALERFAAADPRGLYDRCRAEDISMCGLRPAVAVLRALETERRAAVEITGYDTSARISGDTSRVVGYAGAVLA
ncbi:MAG: AmmeMemoRadiSam system radical SAM enzyme [Verrucomicrobiales bacterium]|nr:AmmeMemoRadiSam system radical SAM enzyme [Verrucomicrobiales bacterium]